MDKLIECSECAGFMKSSAGACPHCGARVSGRRRAALLLGLAGCASLGLTMMACYGIPPCEPGTEGCYTPTDSGADTGNADGGGVG